MRSIGIFLAALVLIFSVAGCNKSRREYYSVAPVTTYSVVYVDNVSNNDVVELNDSIASIISAILADRPQVVNNIDVTINITKNRIGPFNGSNHIKNKSILIFCGEDNECPELYEKLFTYLCGEKEYEREAQRCKQRGRQLTSDNANRNRGRRNR